MKKIVDDERIMYKVCDMYYRQDLNQQEIASKLKISRPSISKIITNAKKCGLIKVVIDDRFKNKFFDIEKKLERKFGLKEVVIVESDVHKDKLHRSLARATAEYLKRTISEGNCIGVSMGRTLSYISEYVGKAGVKNTTFIPLIGGVGQLKMEVHTNPIVVGLAKSFGGDFMLLHAPALVSNHRIKEALIKEDYIRPIFEMMDKVDVAVLGIGYPSDSSTIMHTGYYTTEDFAKLRKDGAIGDICMCFYDENGNTDKYEVNKNVFSIDIKKLRNIGHSIGVAGGKEKTPSIKGAIKGGYINVLITDYDVAKSLCED